MGSRARASRQVAAVLAASLAIGLLGASPAPASVASDQAQIVAIQRRIAEEGAHVRSLVTRENAAQAKVDDLNRKITADEQRVAADRRREDVQRVRLRRLAVSAYITDGGMNSSVLDVFGDNESMTALMTRRTYAGSVGNQLVDAITALETARHATEDDVRTVRAAQNEVTHTLGELRKEHRAVTAAIADEQKTLESVKQDLRTQMQLEQQAAQLATEQALAKYPWPTTGGPLPPIPPATPGSYANPLRAIRGLIPERIDMGVDYAGYGVIFAIGDGIVLTTTVPGWPGGTMIVYQLTDGPANGLVVYAAEDIAPAVKVGDTVTANTPLGLMYLGPDGIETGWGDPAVIGNTLAGDTHQFDGANTTAFGANFSQFMQWLGAPPGIPQNNPPTGKLPANWPRWDTPPPPH